MKGEIEVSNFNSNTSTSKLQNLRQKREQTGSVSRLAKPTASATNMVTPQRGFKEKEFNSVKSSRYLNNRDKEFSQGGTDMSDAQSVKQSTGTKEKKTGLFSKIIGGIGAG